MGLGGMGTLLLLALSTLVSMAHAQTPLAPETDAIRRLYALACTVNRSKGHGGTERVKLNCREANGRPVPAPFVGPGKVTGDLIVREGRVSREQGSKLTNISLRNCWRTYIVGNLEAEGVLSTGGGTSILQLTPYRKFDREPARLPDGNVLNAVRLEWEDLDGIPDANATGYVEVLEKF
jgi:hypothetical protein